MIYYYIASPECKVLRGLDGNLRFILYLIMSEAAANIMCHCHCLISSARLDRVLFVFARFCSLSHTYADFNRVFPRKFLTLCPLFVFARFRHPPAITLIIDDKIFNNTWYCERRSPMDRLHRNK